MIERVGPGEYELICDVCEEETHIFETFHDAVAFKKDNGWKSKREKGYWNDLCPTCRKESEDVSRSREI